MGGAGSGRHSSPGAIVKRMTASPPALAMTPGGGNLTLPPTIHLKNGVKISDKFPIGEVVFSDGTGFATDSNFYWDNTGKRLGIGTDNPLSKLFIEAPDSNGNIGNSGTAININQTTTALRLGVDETNGYAWIQATTPGGSSDKNLILNGATGTTGNVGIRTTTNINSELTFAKNSTIAVNTVDTSDDGYLVLAGGGTFSTSRGGAVWVYGNEHATQGGNIQLIPGNAAGDRVDLDGTLYVVDGEVGIGTTSPNGILHLRADDPQFYIEDSAGAQLLIRPAGADDIRIIANGANDYFTFYNTNTPLMRIENDGDVGIGTITPAGKLHLSGGAHFISNTTAPSTPTNAGALFVSGGELWFIGSSGTQTKIADA